MDTVSGAGRRTKLYTAVRIPVADRARMEAHGDKTGQTMSEIVRAAVAEYLDHREVPYPPVEQA